MIETQTRQYKGVQYHFNKYGRTEFTLFCNGEELFFALESDIKYFIDNRHVYQGK